MQTTHYYYLFTWGNSPQFMPEIIPKNVQTEYNTH